MTGRHLAFPFAIGTDGRTATPADLDEQVRGEIIQLLLTNSGERPFLPSFGGGLRRYIFQGNDAVTAGLTKAALSHAISHWLGHRIEVQTLVVEAQESTLSVNLRYKVLATGTEKYLRFEHQGTG